MYVQQFSAPIATDLDVAAFEAAWRQVIARHPVLRTSIRGWDEGQPRQVVHRRVPLPLEHRDWSELGRAAVAARLDAFLAEDRTRGFDPAEAPLLRLTLIRTGPASFHLVLSNHHALMDGWCAPIILGEVLACYEANLAGARDLPPTRPYRDYIDWLGSVDPARAKRSGGATCAVSASRLRCRWRSRRSDPGRGRAAESPSWNGRACVPEPG